jgi:hypothetical protein
MTEEFSLSWDGLGLTGDSIGCGVFPFLSLQRVSMPCAKSSLLFEASLSKKIVFDGPNKIVASNEPMNISTQTMKHMKT